MDPPSVVTFSSPVCASVSVSVCEAGSACKCVSRWMNQLKVYVQVSLYLCMPMYLYMHLHVYLSLCVQWIHCSLQSLPSLSPYHCHPTPILSASLTLHPLSALLHPLPYLCPCEPLTISLFFCTPHPLSALYKPSLWVTVLWGDI